MGKSFKDIMNICLNLSFLYSFRFARILYEFGNIFGDRAIQKVLNFLYHNNQLSICSYLKLNLLLCYYTFYE